MIYLTDNFDDTINPFETKRGLSASPTPGGIPKTVEKPQTPKPTAVVTETPAVQESNSLAEEPVQPEPVPSQPEPIPEPVVSESATTVESEPLQFEPEPEQPKPAEPEPKAEPEPNQPEQIPEPETEDEPIPPKASYAIDWDKFDEANFNPFATT